MMLNFVTYFSHHESGIRTNKPFLNNFRKEKEFKIIFFIWRHLPPYKRLKQLLWRQESIYNNNVCKYQQRKQFPKYFIGKHLSLVDNIDYWPISWWLERRSRIIKIISIIEFIECRGSNQRREDYWSYRQATLFVQTW